MSETINLKSFNFTDDELKELKKKQEEKSRYSFGVGHFI